MVFGLGKSSSDDGGDDGGFKRDPRKARRFFEHAETISEARNWDYAIDCFISGLKHEPDNLAKHEELYDVAKRRKVSGGKPAGFTERLKSGGSSPVDKMLHSERLWAMDPLNVKLARDVMRHAVDGHEDDTEEAQLGEVAFWVGKHAMDFNDQQKKDKKLYLELTDLFSRIGRYDMAVENLKKAIRQDPGNTDLMTQLKELEAENMMAKGSYGGGAEGDFRKNIADAEGARDLEQSSSTSGAGSSKEAVIERRRKDLEEDPEDLERQTKLIDALLKKETAETEKEAVQMLRALHEQTGQYRYKVRAGDVTMKTLNRIIRDLTATYRDNPEDADAKAKLQEAMQRRLKFELGEYAERVQNYPTDLGLKFQYGLRLFQTEQFDEAIGMFQQARSDPKSKAAGSLYLGRCYIHKEWFDEAIQTFREGIEQHPQKDDKVGLELRYRLMDALLHGAKKSKTLEQAKEARETGSQILQTDINYRDIKARVDEARELVSQLQEA